MQAISMFTSDTMKYNKKQGKSLKFCLKLLFCTRGYMVVGWRMTGSSLRNMTRLLVGCCVSATQTTPDKLIAVLIVMFRPRTRFSFIGQVSFSEHRNSNTNHESHSHEIRECS